MGESYGGYKLPALWTIVADEDPEAGFTHVNTLNRLRAALEQQRDNLRAHRDRLMEGWPPERSEAAATFVVRINDMIDAMGGTIGAAGRICIGVDEAYAAIRDARRQLEPLMARYSAQNAGDKGRMDQLGRQVMMFADAKVSVAAKYIGTSVPSYRASYEPGTEIIDQHQGRSGEGGAGAVGGGTRQSGMLPPPVFDPPRPANDDETGPSLAGVATVDAPVAPAGGGQPAGNASRLIFNPGLVIGLDPISPVGRPPSSEPLGNRFSGSPTTETPQRTGTGQAGRGALAEQASVTTGGSPYGGGGGYRDRSYETYAARRRAKRGDDDEQWAVAEGVPPVLEAPPERVHDPGPGVLGIDR